MTPRLLVLIPVFCGIGAAQSLRNLGDMAGFWAVFWGTLACVGVAVVVAFLFGWPEVRVEEMPTCPGPPIKRLSAMMGRTYERPGFQAVEEGDDHAG